MMCSGISGSEGGLKAVLPRKGAGCSYSLGQVSLLGVLPVRRDHGCQHSQDLLTADVWHVTLRKRSEHISKSSTDPEQSPNQIRTNPAANH